MMSLSFSWYAETCKRGASNGHQAVTAKDRIAMQTLSEFVVRPRDKPDVPVAVVGVLLHVVSVPSGVDYRRDRIKTRWKSFR